MEPPDFNIDLKQVKHDLLKGIKECSQRGLNQSMKWLAELNHSISHVKLSAQELPIVTDDLDDDLESYLLAKAYFDLKEYDRAANITKQCTKPVSRFLHLYSRFFSIEKKKLDNMTDSNCPPDPTKNSAMVELCAVLKNDAFENKMDGYCFYLYGVILRKLDLTSLAIDIFVQAVNAAPLMWGAWQELGQLIPDKNKLNEINLPDHWMKYFFMGHAYLEQLNNDEALHIYTNLHEQGFEKSTYLMAQMAILNHNRRGKNLPIYYIISGSN